MIIIVLFQLSISRRCGDALSADHAREWKKWRICLLNCHLLYIRLHKQQVNRHSTGSWTPFTFLVVLWFVFFYSATYFIFSLFSSKRTKFYKELFFFPLWYNVIKCLWIAGQNELLPYFSRENQLEKRNKKSIESKKC